MIIKLDYSELPNAILKGDRYHFTGLLEGWQLVKCDLPFEWYLYDAEENCIAGFDKVDEAMEAIKPLYQAAYQKETIIKLIQNEIASNL